ncbi:transcriptional regulator, RpiR family [Dethiosulfatibacter aminovorans DSM 17477]|uniref:Transcriptional regulator, RpiR family n=1 Tax=Dethiosulfatibacter aminovorans DSM 17477 TaxID=1121476 RepID=A0A1M6N3A4_9FIRM|nr:MurR/RpiR family transcriptional regulator [Dethiosulfatibacter aminovorans]SHJ90166.1 transcriptional regulator, RpiR family [Dethiosulfatibacter aminovorans DSM 17477]
MDELLSKINESLPDLPQAQKQVAIFVLENYRDIPFLSVVNMSKLIGVSETTIIKFCVLMGFSGFSTFKKEISNYVQTGITMYNALEDNLSDIEEYGTYDKVLNYDLNNIQNTLNNEINRNNLKKLVNKIEEADNIYVIGFRTSAILSEYLSLILRQQGRKVSCIIPGLGDYADKLCSIKKDDLLISFSFSRYSRDVIKAVRLMKSKGVTCAVFTDSAACPLYSLTDIVFLCETKSSHYSTSYVGCFSLFNALFTETSLVRKEQTTNNLKKLESILNEFDTFSY